MSCKKESAFMPSIYLDVFEDPVTQDDPNWATCHEMAVLGAEGDTRIMWDPERPAEVEAARAAFDRLIREGYTAYSVTDDGERGRRVDSFDPALQALILVPRIVGG
jgi:hypothetical protein